MTWVEVFIAFVVSHLVGDYLLQTDWQARHKRGGLARGARDARRALFTHVGIYTLCFVPALIVSDLGVELLWVLPAIFLPHLIQDDGRLLHAYMKRRQAAGSAGKPGGVDRGRSDVPSAGAARPGAGDRLLMRRVQRLLMVLICVLGPTAPAFASTSGAQLWTALAGKVICGVATHPPNTPPIQLLCSAPQVPAPKTKGIGDPGFVFLGSVGRPSLARLSQDSFVASSPAALESPSKWGIGPIQVTCTISTRAVRCTNRSHHGFTITKSSYRAF